MLDEHGFREIVLPSPGHSGEGRHFRIGAEGVNQMREIRIVMKFIGVFLAVLIVLFVVNQTTQIVNLAGGIDSTLGLLVLYGLLLFYLAVITVPAVMLLRLPPILLAPSESSPEYGEYLEKIAARLRKNVHVRHRKIDAKDIISVEGALRELDGIATARMKDIGKGVFIATSISQYGTLDAFIVLSALFRMVWQVATVYNQRPRLREMASLYVNVAATSIVASEMENLVVLENQLEPIFAQLVGSGLATGASSVTSVVVNSLVQGSANAFLVLRVGAIAKGYCASITKTNRNSIRSSAIVQAAALLGGVVGESSVKITGAIGRAARRAGGRVVVAGGRFVVNRSLRTWKAARDSGEATLTLGKEGGLALVQGLERITSAITRFFRGGADEQ